MSSSCLDRLSHNDHAVLGSMSWTSVVVLVVGIRTDEDGKSFQILTPAPAYCFASA